MEMKERENVDYQLGDISECKHRGPLSKVNDPIPPAPRLIALARVDLPVYT
jgi:hypothetical protein